MDWKDGLILGATALGILTWDSWRNYKSLQVDMSGYRFYDVNLANNSAKLRVDLMVHNPLLFGVTLYSLYGFVYIDGIKVAKINTIYDYYISGKRTHVIPIVADCDILSVSQIIARMMAGTNKEEMILQFNGELRCGRNGVVGVPVNVGIVMSELGE